MGSFGGFYKGEKRKLKKSILEEKARKAGFSGPSTFELPKIIRKDKKTW